MDEGKEVNPEIELAADALSQSLANIAMPSKAVRKTSPSGRKSRFFYVLPETLDEYIERQSAQTQETRQLAENIEAIVSERTERYVEELPPILDDYINEVREFFLQEVNPLIIAGSVGSKQAQDVLQRLVGTGVDLEPYNQFDKTLRLAAKAKIRAYVSEYMDVPISDIINTEQPKEVVIVDGGKNGSKSTDRPVSGPVRK